MFKNIKIAVLSTCLIVSTQLCALAGGAAATHPNGWRTVQTRNADGTVTISIYDARGRLRGRIRGRARTRPWPQKKVVRKKAPRQKAPRCKKPQRKARHLIMWQTRKGKIRIGRYDAQGKLLQYGAFNRSYGYRGR